MVTRSQPALLPARQSIDSEAALRPKTGVQTEEMWRGKEKNGETEFPSPASSEYHLPLSIRPKSAGMSQFTARENRRLEYRSDLQTMLSPKSGLESGSTSRLRSPTDKDFQRVLDRLQKLQTGNIGNRRILLSDSKDEELIMEPDEIQFFKIRCLGRPCPLKVTVEREKGALLIYMSRTITEPTEGEAEAVYKKDEFVISDPGLRFKTEFFYLGAKALNQTIFTIGLKYGKRGVSQSEANLRARREAELEEDAHLEELRKLLKPKASTYRDNFIKRNIQVLSPTSSKSLKVKRKQAEERRKAVLVRKQTVIETKRQRTYLVLHRHELRMQAEEKAREIMELIARKETYEKAWLMLLFHQQGIDVLNAQFVRRKAEIELARRRNKAAILIQRFVRQQLSGLDRTGLGLRASRNSLLLYARLMFRPIRRTAKVKIVRVLKAALKNSILPMAASRMLRRSNP